MEEEELIKKLTRSFCASYTSLTKMGNLQLEEMGEKTLKRLIECFKKMRNDPDGASLSTHVISLLVIVCQISLETSRRNNLEDSDKELMEQVFVEMDGFVAMNSLVADPKAYENTDE